MNAVDKRKVVIIGSGIGGSGLGALLAAGGGWDVHLVEKNPFLGGRFATYEKEGYKIDLGCHIIANCENGTMGEILRRIGRPEAVRWAHTVRPSPIFRFCGEWMKFPKEIWKLKLPAADLQRMMALFTELAAWDEAKCREHDDVDMVSFLRRYSGDEKLLAVFQYILAMYFVVSAEETPVGEWVRCNQILNRYHTTGYPVGGTGEIPKAYADCIREKGGRVSLERPVRKILVENSRATGVEYADGKVERADLVVSNAGIKATVLALAGPEHFPEKFVKKVEGYEYAHSSFVLKLALKRPVTDQKMIMYASDWSKERWGAAVRSGKRPDRALALMLPVISNLDPGCAPPGKQLLIVGSGLASITEFPELGREGWEACVMHGVRDIWPEIDELIEFVDVTGPEEIDRAAGEAGGVIGVAQKIGQIGPDRPPRKLPGVENLYCSCADTGEHGIGGELAADAALRLYAELAPGAG